MATGLQGRFSSMIQSAFSYGIDFGVSLLSGIRDPLTRTMPDAVDTSSPTGHLTPLVVEAQQGSERAFRELVRIHKNQVLRLAARFAANTAELDELAQDIFIDLHRSLKRFRGKAPLEHWLSRIASRRCRDHLRRRYRRDRFRSLDSMQESGFDPWVSEKIDERVELMMDAMRQLKPDDQTVLILFSLEGYSIKDIADHFSWTDSKVKVRLFRARKELKARMNHETH